MQETPLAKSHRDKVDQKKPESEVENRHVINRLTNTLGAAGASETVELHTGDSLPIVVETDLADEKGKLVCYLAPRFEAD